MVMVIMMALMTLVMLKKNGFILRAGAAGTISAVHGSTAGACRWRNAKARRCALRAGCWFIVAIIIISAVVCTRKWVVVRVALLRRENTCGAGRTAASPVFKRARMFDVPLAAVAVPPGATCVVVAVAVIVINGAAGATLAVAIVIVIKGIEGGKGIVGRRRSMAWSEKGANVYLVGIAVASVIQLKQRPCRHNVL